MRRGTTEKVLVDRLDATGGRHRRQDDLVVEEPLEIRLDDQRVATTMRTPGHDFELAAGFCHTAGLLGPDPITTIRYCGTEGAAETEYNVVTVDTGGRAATPTARLGVISSSCGICGTDAIDELTARLEPLRPVAGFDPGVLLAAVESVSAEQPLFRRTGGVHAAAAFDSGGRPEVVREDIGRHNAVDKVVGALLLEGRLPATGLGLYVSGRSSFEMVQKAWAAGFSALVSISAPSALAVEAARAAKLTLIGFVRGSEANIYVAGPDF